MKQLFIRVFFGAIILLVNILIIILVGKPQIPIFQYYEIDLRVLIPFLGLLFLEPFISLFNPFLCSIQTLKSTNDSENESTITHKIEYRGKDPLDIQLKIHSSTYDVECKKGEAIQEMFIPNLTKIQVSKEKPNEIITFLLKRKESSPEPLLGIKATIVYKKDFLTKKIHII